MRTRQWVSSFMAFALLLPSVVGAVSPPTFGFSPAELNQMKRNGANPADVRTLLAGVDSYIVQLARRNRVPVPALRGSLTQKIIRAPATDRTLEKAFAQAEDSAKQIIAFKAENATLRAELEQIKDVKLRTPAILALAEAQRAIDEGRLDDANSALGKLQPLRFSEAAGASELWVTVVEMNARVAALQGDYDRQKQIGEDAYEQDARNSRDRQWKFKMISADASFRKGISNEDNMILALAIRIYRDEALPLAPRNERPDNWAKTKVELGIALWQLGSNETKPANLEAALTAFKEAREVTTFSRSPKLWADIRIYEGNTLLSRNRIVGGETVGKIESADDAKDLLAGLIPESNKILSNAKSAYLDSLEFYSKTSNIYVYSIINNNISRVLIELDGYKNLIDAIRISKDILNSNAFVENTGSLASVYFNIGRAYSSLYRNEQKSEYFEECKKNFESSIKIWTSLGSRSANAQSQLGLASCTMIAAVVQRDLGLLDVAEMHLLAARRYADGVDSVVIEQANFALKLIVDVRSQLK